MDVLTLCRFALALWKVPLLLSDEPLPAMKRHPSTIPLGCPIVSTGDIPRFVQDRLIARAKGMTLVSVEAKDDLWLIEFADTAKRGSPQRAIPDTPWYLVDLGAKAPMTVGPDSSSVCRGLLSLLNTAHPFVRWLIRLRDAGDATPSVVDPAAVRAAWKVMAEAPWNGRDLVSRWRRAAELPRELLPPPVEETFPGYLRLLGRETIIARGK